MIVSSLAARLGAFGLALGLHGVLMLNLSPDGETKLEGAAGQAEVRLGSSFADMAAGALRAKEVTEVQAPAPVVAKAPTPDPKVAQSAQPKAVSPLISQRVAVAQASKPTLAKQPRVSQADTPAAKQIQKPAEPKEQTLALLKQPVLRPSAVIAASPRVAQAVKPVAVQPLVPKPDAVVSKPKEVAQRVTPDVLRPKEATEAQIAAQETGNAAVARSLRPKVRPQHVQALGNAKVDAQAGVTTGKKKAKAASSGAATRAKSEAGNAAANSYPGAVMRQISRVRRPAVGVAGTVRIAFRINGSGGLAALSVAQSSGSERLDKAALRVIRRAAPFPPPPEGAQRSFSISIQGQ